MRSPVSILIATAVVVLAVAVALIAETPTGWKWGDDGSSQASAVPRAAPR